MADAPKKQKARALMLRVTADGRFEPADQLSQEVCRARKYRVGDILSTDMKKPRSYVQWKKAHKLGQLLAENLDDFAGMDAHRVLKRIQVETGIGCDEMPIKAEGLGMVIYRIPRSLAFDQMEEGVFQETYAGFCRHIIKTYWQTLTAEEIDEMATLVGMAA